MGERSRWNLPRKVRFDLYVFSEGTLVGVTAALVEPCDMVADRVRRDVLPDEYDVARPVASADGAVVLHILDDCIDVKRQQKGMISHEDARTLPVCRVLRDCDDLDEDLVVRGAWYRDLLHPSGLSGLGNQSFHALWNGDRHCGELLMGGSC